MSQFALSDNILQQIEKPARYIGNETNVIKKDLTQVKIRFCMCFPDVYEIGMSHLGMQILYDLLNQRADTYCERVYAPWVDLDAILREQHIPLFALESQDPIRQFDFLGITLQYEMCYTNVLQILDLSGIPIFAKDRTQADPIVIGGGPCAYNPEPIAAFFDFFYIGEGETAYDAILDLYLKNQQQNGTRRQFLEQVAQIEGMYVPALYDVSYQEDGTIAAFTPNHVNAKKTIRKQVVSDFSSVSYPKKPLVPFLKVTQDRAVLEVQRGCMRGCRFCQAGMIYRPLREKDVEQLKQAAQQILEETGQEEISLSSLSTSDYRELEQFVLYLVQFCKERKINISLPSLRIDAFSLDIMSKVQNVKKSSLTFAPEAGSQRLRDVINKGLTEQEILTGALQAFHGGWNRVKLYFMLGLPTETNADIEAIAALADQIAKEYYQNIPKEQRTGRVQVLVSTSFFVPKPFTPFQWVAMDSNEMFLEKQRYLNQKLRQQCNHKSLQYHWHEAELTLLEGVFARGDRKLSAVLYDAYRSGCLYDAWSEHFSYEKWMAAFQKNQIDPLFYTSRKRPITEILPWDFIDIGVSRKFLEKEYERAQKEIVTPNCRKACAGCGASQFHGGVCHES